MEKVLQYLCLLMTSSIGFAQEDTIELNAAVVNESLVEPTDVICNTCSCSEGTVDCSARELQSFFTIEDWTGLKAANPNIVDLSTNTLSYVTRIAELPIQTLNMSNCQIEKIQFFTFSNLKDLAVLDLSYNKIATAQLSRRVFDRFPPAPGMEHRTFQDIRTVSLAYNDIHSLPQDLFDSMPGLTSLDLSGNPLALIDQLTHAVIASLQNLRELKLASCELESLPDGLFRSQRRLERLDLSDNRFTTIPSVVSDAVNLQYLSLNKNLMVNISETTAISSLTKLQELRLCRFSKLTSISAGALGGLKSLVSLHICRNPRLTTIDPDFLMWTDEHEGENFPLLQTLHMQSNNISRISSDFLDRWDQLADVDFSNNPFDCDCNAQWMVEVLVPIIRSSQTNGTLDNMYCKGPQDIRGISFATLAETSRTLVCPESERMSDVPAPDTAIILGIMIGIFVTFPIVLIVVLSWRRGYFAKCRRKVFKEQPDSDDEEHAF